MKLEPVSGTWVFTAPVPGSVTSFPWKAPYTVAGRLTNPTHATMTPSSVVLNEIPSFGAPITRIAIPSLGSIVPNAFGSSIWALMQAWSWLAPGVWFPIGPLVVGFTYSVTFAMQDAYGNTYPAITSPTGFVAIVVSPAKIAFAVVAHLLFALGITLAVAGLAWLLSGDVPTAGGLFAAAGAALTISAGFGIAALDPPVPDFSYRSVVATRLPELPAEVTTHPAFAPLLPIFALTARIGGLTASMSATEARLIAARIDRDASAILLQASEYRALRDSLLAAAHQIPLAAFEAVDGVRAQPALAPLTNARALQRTLATWSRSGLPAKLRRGWIDSGLPEQQLKEMEEALRTPERFARPIDVLMNELAQAAAQIASSVQDEANTVLHSPTTDGDLNM